MHEKMNIGEICNREVVFATEDMSVKEAAELMRDQHVGSLVVIRQADLGRVVVGMVTDRDIAIVAVARDFDPQTLRVADVMQAPAHTISAAQPAFSALQMMRRHGVRRLPVTGEFGELAGLLSLDDLLDTYAAEMAMFAQAIRRERKEEQRVMV